MSIADQDTLSELLQKKYTKLNISQMQNIMNVLKDPTPKFKKGISILKEDWLITCQPDEMTVICSYCLHHFVLMHPSFSTVSSSLDALLNFKKCNDNCENVLSPNMELIITNYRLRYQDKIRKNNEFQTAIAQAKQLRNQKMNNELTKLLFDNDVKKIYESFKRCQQSAEINGLSSGTQNHHSMLQPSTAQKDTAPTSGKWWQQHGKLLEKLLKK